MPLIQLTSQADLPEWGMLELQGTLEVQGNNGLDGLYVGEIQRLTDVSDIVEQINKLVNQIQFIKHSSKFAFFFFSKYFFYKH